MSATADRYITCPICWSEDAQQTGPEEFACPQGCRSELIRERLAPIAFAQWEEPIADVVPLLSGSWLPVDLGPILDGNHTDEAPEILSRVDGVCLLYRGRLHSVSAEPEAGKGWLACAAVAEQLAAAESVLYVDCEDTPANIVTRLRALGVDDATIRLRFRYVRPDEPISTNALDGLLALTPGLVVIDGVTEALAIEGLDLASNQDIASFYTKLARPFARAGAAVLLIDHVTKDRETRGRYAIGAQHKLAGVDVAYKLDVAQPFGRGREGLVKVTVTKDRPGFVRQHAADRERIALMRLTSHDDGAVTVALEPPERGEGETFRPTNRMEAVSRLLEVEPGLSRTAIRGAVRGKATIVDTAVEMLVSEGYVRVEHIGQTKQHHSTRPFRETDQVPLSHPVPTPSGQGAGETLSPCPAPTKGTGDRDSVLPTLDDTPSQDRAERLLADHADLNQEAA